MSKPQAPMAIATRTSPLAMAQALDVQARLAAAAGADTETAFPIMGMKTTGDKITDPERSEAFVQQAGAQATFVPMPGLYHEMHREPEKTQVWQSYTDWMAGRLTA